MDELGIIINQNRESMSFGKWKPRELRNENNSDDWHTDSFLKQVYPTTWFQNLGIPYNLTKEFQNQLDLFARYGCVAIANSRENSNSVGESRLVITSSNTITEEQIQALNEKREAFLEFGNGHYSFIDIFDVNEEYSILEEFYNINDYYHYLDSLVESKQRRAG